MTYIFNIEPRNYHRMTRYSKYSQEAKLYHEWMNRLQKIMLSQNFHMPECNFTLTFYVPIPEKLSKKEKAIRLNNPHQIKPDDDNFYKAFKDAYFQKRMNGRRKDVYCAANRTDTRDDKVVWESHIRKYWCERGQERIEIVIK